MEESWGEGKEEERKGKERRKKKTREGLERFFFKKEFSQEKKNLKATPLVSIKGPLDEEGAIHAVNSSESS